MLSLKEIERVKKESESVKADVVVGIGGGKTLDTAKAVANKIGVPVIIVPTAASTDSPTSAMAVIYTEEVFDVVSKKEQLVKIKINP